MRKKNSIKNIVTALLGQVIGVILSFISRTIFIKYLGAEYLGINGLFTNILSILSLAELGIGTAIIYSLYKPLALKENAQIKALINFYKKVYNIIGVTILGIGIVLIPFLDNIIKDSPQVSRLGFIYCLFLINTVVSYFYTYKRSLIIADQKGYVVNIYRYVFNVILNIVQMIILITTKQYEIYLVLRIILTLIENISISYKANKLYPFLKEKNISKLDEETRREINKNVKALMYHKIGGVVVTGTDNILISSFVGLIWVGLYSNYQLIVSSINMIIGQIFDAITASVGNLNALESKEKKYQTYEKILFFNFWIAGFCCITLFELFNNFIELWVGGQYLFEDFLVFIIVLNFYMTLTRRTNWVYKDSMGLFWHDRYKPLCEGIVNMIVSISLAPKLGIVGVFIGTFVSTITTAFWIEPYILYKYGFEMKVRGYFLSYIKYTTIILVAGIITDQICSVFTTVTWISLFGRAAVCMIVPNLVFLGCSYRTDEFKYFWNLFKEIVDKLPKLKARPLS